MHFSMYLKWVGILHSSRNVTNTYIACSYDIPVLYVLQLSGCCMYCSDVDHPENLVITGQLIGLVLD